MREHHQVVRVERAEPWISFSSNGIVITTSDKVIGCGVVLEWTAYPAAR